VRQLAHAGGASGRCNRSRGQLMLRLALSESW
jgi:hypothetical protein